MKTKSRTTGRAYKITKHICYYIKKQQEDNTPLTEKQVKDLIQGIKNALKATYPDSFQTTYYDNLVHFYLKK